MADAPVVAPPAAAPAAVTATAPVEAVGVEGAEAAGAEEVAAPAEPPRKFKVKVDGQEREYDEDEARRLISLSGAAYQRMEEAAQIKKMQTQLIQALEADPVGTVLKIAQARNIPPEKVKEAMAKLLLTDYEREQLDPKERALAEREAKIAAAEAEMKKESDRRQAAAEEAAAQAEMKRIGDEFAAALKDSGIPRTPKAVARLAELVERDDRLGLHHSLKDLVKVVKSEYLDAQKQLLSGLGDEELAQFLGEDAIKKLRARDTEAAKRNPAALRPVPRGNGAAPPRQAGKRPMNEADWARRFGKY